jgi:hypothetical protein
MPEKFAGNGFVANWMTAEKIAAATNLVRS